MGINFKNLFSSQKNKSTMGDYQNLDHIDGVAISTVSANLYGNSRDDLVIFYFRDGANHASAYTQSTIVSENIKWNKNQRNEKVYSLLVNTRNANAFTGAKGYQSMQKLAELISLKLTEKQKEDDNNPDVILPEQILFGCTGTIGEIFPYEKIKKNIPKLLDQIKYTQNKFIWTKAALGMMTTDTKPKLAMEECFIGSSKVKIYGIAKGSGMIQPNMATTLCYIFTDAKIPNDILKKLLLKNISNTFNAITCDSDTSTNDMISIFATNKANNQKINSISDKKIIEFDKSLNQVLLNLAKRVVADGEGASKFITINVKNCHSEKDARTIGFSIANSPLVKTAIAGEDPNWGRIVMAIGKSGIEIDLTKLSIKFGDHKIVVNGKLIEKYDESILSDYMKNYAIEIEVELGIGKKSFTTYTMDFTKKYIEINADYRS